MKGWQKVKNLQIPRRGADAAVSPVAAADCCVQVLLLSSFCVCWLTTFPKMPLDNIEFVFNPKNMGPQLNGFELSLKKIFCFLCRPHEAPNSQACLFPLFQVLVRHETWSKNSHLSTGSVQWKIYSSQKTAWCFKVSLCNNGNFMTRVFIPLLSNLAGMFVWCQNVVQQELSQV